jgi:hypothetical protein
VARRLAAIAAALCAGCTSAPTTYGDYGELAVTSLEREFYTGSGTYYSCQGGCVARNIDWGDDSLTFTLYLRWQTTRDPTLAPIFSSLVATAHSYATCVDCDAWSDTPEWDAVADEREYEVTGDPGALDLAKRAYSSVEDSAIYALGACPSIRYQRSFAANAGLKTLETDSNAIKAGVLLWRATGTAAYLDEAKATYDAVRRYFLDPSIPLYTTYVFDDGKTCAQVPARFFASVNGNMIWNGIALTSATGDARYFGDAIATGHAVDERLADDRGIFADLQAENDVVEPLVEGFYSLAVDAHQDFARDWILKNATAAIGDARTGDGTYGRFFDGPAPTARTTVWQANGGLSLAIAAAALDPSERVPFDPGWSGGRSTPIDLSTLPSSLSFTGSGIALYGTLGEHCCEPGHASVAIDGRTTTDETGIWQNKSSAGQAFADTVLFAWRWPVSGPHTLQFGPSTTNAKEGGPFLHLQRYVVLP